MGLDDLRQFRLVRRQAGQDRRQHALALARRHRHRAEQTAAIVEHQLEIDIRQSLVRPRPHMRDEAVHHVALVQEAGKARIAAEGRGQVRSRQQVPGLLQLRVQVRPAFQDETFHACQRIEQPARDQKRAVRGPPHPVERGVDRPVILRERVPSVKARPADPAKCAQGLARGLDPVEHAADMDHRDGVRDDGLRCRDQVEPRQPALALEIEGGGERRLRIDLLGKEANASGRRQDVGALEPGDGDLVAVGVAEPLNRYEAGFEPLRPTLEEQPAALGPRDELDETRLLGSARQEVGDERRAPSRRGAVCRKRRTPAEVPAPPRTSRTSGPAETSRCSGRASRANGSPVASSSCAPCCGIAGNSATAAWLPSPRRHDSATQVPAPSTVPRGGSRSGARSMISATRPPGSTIAADGEIRRGSATSILRSIRVMPPYPVSQHVRWWEAAGVQAMRVWLSCRLSSMAWAAWPPASPPRIDR